MEHTKGRWTVDEVTVCEPPGYAYRIRKDDEIQPPWPIALTIMESDARLIAAAPALLSALEQLADEQALFAPQLPQIYMKRLERARAAILAAKGDK